MDENVRNIIKKLRENIGSYKDNYINGHEELKNNMDSIDANIEETSELLAKSKELREKLEKIENDIKAEEAKANNINSTIANLSDNADPYALDNLSIDTTLDNIDALEKDRNATRKEIFSIEREYAKTLYKNGVLSKDAEENIKKMGIDRQEHINAIGSIEIETENKIKELDSKIEQMNAALALITNEDKIVTDIKNRIIQIETEKKLLNDIVLENIIKTYEVSFKEITNNEKDDILREASLDDIEEILNILDSINYDDIEDAISKLTKIDEKIDSKYDRVSITTKDGEYRYTYKHANGNGRVSGNDLNDIRTDIIYHRLGINPEDEEIEQIGNIIIRFDIDGEKRNVKFKDIDEFLEKYLKTEESLDKTNENDELSELKEETEKINQEEQNKKTEEEQKEKNEKILTEEEINKILNEKVSTNVQIDDEEAKDEKFFTIEELLKNQDYDLPSFSEISDTNKKYKALIVYGKACVIDRKTKKTIDDINIVRTAVLAQVWADMGKFTLKNGKSYYASFEKGASRMYKALWKNIDKQLADYENVDYEMLCDNLDRVNYKYSFTMATNLEHDEYAKKFLVEFYKNSRKYKDYFDYEEDKEENKIEIKEEEKPNEEIQLSPKEINHGQKELTKTIMKMRVVKSKSATKKVTLAALTVAGLAIIMTGNVGLGAATIGSAIASYEKMYKGGNLKAWVITKKLSKIAKKYGLEYRLINGKAEFTTKYGEIVNRQTPGIDFDKIDKDLAKAFNNEQRKMNTNNIDIEKDFDINGYYKGVEALTPVTFDNLSAAFQELGGPGTPADFSTTGKDSENIEKEYYENEHTLDKLENLAEKNQSLYNEGILDLNKNEFINDNISDNLISDEIMFDEPEVIEDEKEKSNFNNNELVENNQNDLIEEELPEIQPVANEENIEIQNISDELIEEEIPEVQPIVNDEIISTEPLNADIKEDNFEEKNISDDLLPTIQEQKVEVPMELPEDTELEKMMDEIKEENKIEPLPDVKYPSFTNPLENNVSEPINFDETITLPVVNADNVEDEKVQESNDNSDTFSDIDDLLATIQSDVEEKNNDKPKELDMILDGTNNYIDNTSAYNDYVNSLMNENIEDGKGMVK